MRRREFRLLERRGWLRDQGRQLADRFNGDSVGAGWVADGIYDNVVNGALGLSSIELTNAWSVNAGYEHFWNPRWRTSLYGGYTRVWYDQDATNLINAHLPTPAAAPFIACGQPVAGAGVPADKC